MAGDSSIETSWTAKPFVPASRSLLTLQRAVQDCKGCPLYADTTQPVFGEGARGARVVLVGEQPGDKEDKQGHPFVGPAGDEAAREIRAALVEDLRRADHLAVADVAEAI